MRRAPPSGIMALAAGLILAESVAKSAPEFVMHRMESVPPLVVGPGVALARHRPSAGFKGKRKARAQQKAAKVARRKNRS